LRQLNLTLLVISFAVATVSPVFGQLGESPDGPEHVVVYLTEEEALAKAFPKADSVWAEVWAPTEEQRRSVQRKLGWRVADSTFTVHRGVKGRQDLGYAVMANEIGLYKPITFMVHLDIEQKVSAVHVMVYRESRGGEVRRRRFLSQYDGKRVSSPVRINRDIIGISGATLSVRALNAGVKKTLAIIEAAYPE